jgi:predicted transcriptional regulator/transcriptional regulator with XRE-family HTH domain
MSRPLIGRTVRRLRSDAGLSQQALAQRLGISASYLNLIEHDQRNVTASLLIKLAEMLRVDLAALSGAEERELEVGLREAFADPSFGNEQVPESEIEGVAANPNAARAVLALYRAFRVAREDASGIALPTGRRILLPNEEARDVFHERANYFGDIEAAAESIAAEMNVPPPEMNHALAERLRKRHQIAVRVAAMEEGLRRYDPETQGLTLSEILPRESRGFHLAFQIMLMEARDVIEQILTSIAPSTPEAASLLRIGLLNYGAAALLMPYESYWESARQLRHDIDALAGRYGVSFEQAAQRLSTLQRPGKRGMPFFFLRVDPAGNVGKRFSAAGFPFARYGGSCPRWVVHQAFSTPGVMRVQVAQLPDGARFLCFARALTGPARHYGDPPPVHVVAMGADAAHAENLVYGDGLDIAAAAVGIGLSCRLCDRPDCRSRAFPPLEHRLAVDPHMAGESPYRFETRRS